MADIRLTDMGYRSGKTAIVARENIGRARQMGMLSVLMLTAIATREDLSMVKGAGMAYLRLVMVRDTQASGETAKEMDTV